jgi:hypothetical protein
VSDRLGANKTGLHGTTALNGPWELRQIKDLVNDDTVRESGSGPH